MNYRRKVSVLVSLSFALVLLFVSSFIFSPENRAARRESVTLLSEEAVESIARIDLSSPIRSESLSLQKNAGTWHAVLDGNVFPPRAEMLKRLLRLLSERTSYIASASSDQAHSALGLEEKSAFRLSAFDASGKALLNLLIGDLSQDGQHVYVRRLSDNRSYLGDTRFDTIAGSAPKDYLDLSLFQPELSADSVQRVQIRTSSFSYALTRRNRTQWALEGSAQAELDSMSVNAWLKGLLSLEADELTYRQTVPAPGSVGEISMDLSDGTSRTLLIAANAESSALHALRVVGTPYSFLVVPAKRERLLKRVESFLQSANKD